MRENRTSGSEGREKGNQPFFLTPILEKKTPAVWTPAGVDLNSSFLAPSPQNPSDASAGGGAFGLLATRRSLSKVVSTNPIIISSHV